MEDRIGQGQQVALEASVGILDLLSEMRLPEEQTGVCRGPGQPSRAWT